MLILVFAFYLSCQCSLKCSSNALSVCYWVCVTRLCVRQEESDRRPPRDIGALVFNLGAVSRASPIPTKINKPWPGHHAWGQSRRNNTAKVNRVLQQSNKAAHIPNRLGSIKSLCMLTRTSILKKNIQNSHAYVFSTSYFQYGVVFYSIMRD